MATRLVLFLAGNQRMQNWNEFYVLTFLQSFMKIYQLVQQAGEGQTRRHDTRTVIPYKTKSVINRNETQAVSRRLPTAASRVQTRFWSCGIL
jgi:hypothetical protein